MRIKPLTKEQILISIDRLTRFRFPESKYVRVFTDLITHNLLEPVFSKSDIEHMDYKTLKKYGQDILNYSIKELTGENSSELTINKKLYKYENSIAFLDENMQWLLKNNIDYHSCVQFINDNSVPNLRWLKALSESNDILQMRKMKGFLFPVEIVVLVEGITESTLLPEFAKLAGFDFDKNGVFVLPAGGKNQVVRIYYELYNQLKLPIYVLFDKDGTRNSKEIEPKLRPNDRIHIINCGEFEDALSKDLVERTLNSELQNISETDINIKEEPGHRVKYLEEIFKHRGMHEFKKVEFAQMVRENISSKTDLTPEITGIIEEIKKIKSYC